MNAEDRQRSPRSLHRFFVAALMASLAVAAIWYFWPRIEKPITVGGGSEKPRPAVKIGIQVSPAMAVVMVAKEKGLFDAEGVDVTLERFTAGKFALQAALAGSVDFAVSGEVPTCLAVLQGNDLRVVAQVVERTVNEVRVVARRDENSASPKRYFNSKKRKLSTSLGGGPEMYTYSFLKHHGIESGDVEIISQKPEDMPAALESGSVDAIAIFDPFAFIAEKRLGDKAVTFTDDDVYSELYVLNASPTQVNKQPEVIEKLLRAMVQAANFIEQNPVEAKGIVRDFTKLDQDVVDGIWSSFVFRPALTSQLIKFWEIETEWARQTGKVDKAIVTPNFRATVIDASILRRVSPDSVRLEN
jgi:ABC-type nitrate/sulfonate/bicarbonate transport system substrate-binding protein